MMSSGWTKYPQLGIDIVSTATSTGFLVAKAGTRFGFGIARTVTSGIAGIAGSTVDIAFSTNAVGPALDSAVSVAFDFVEQVALAPIIIGETITSASLVVAQSSIKALDALFPGSDEASFSLASFVTLVKREWNEPVMSEHLPEERYSATEIGKALIAWAALQGVTHEWQEKRWLEHLREIPNSKDSGHQCDARQRTEPRIHITEDITFTRNASGGNGGQIIAADIGEVGVDTRTLSTRLGTSPPSSVARSKASVPKLKYNLRRFSKMVLAGYGGAGLMFFGVSLQPTTPVGRRTHTNLVDNAQNEEEFSLVDAIDASEQEANAVLATTAPVSPVPTTQTSELKSYSWWNVLMGHHDQDIFEGYAFTPATNRQKSPGEKERRASVIKGSEAGFPRYWVLTDHGRKQVVLVFRGTMSLNELAVDLTCDPAPFTPASTSPLDYSKGDEVDESQSEDIRQMPGSLPNNWFEGKGLRPSAPVSGSSSKQPYIVHGGMLRMARAMGDIGKPVHRVVGDALRKNLGYELVLCGHSLGAGVAALLGLTWADPKTCLTVKCSGLPEGRHVSVYCYAPPCIVCPALSALSSSLIISFVYSNDIVSRLSLGSVRDMTRAAAWLCSANDPRNKAKENNENGKDDGYAAVTRRALMYKAGYGGRDDMDWLLSVRKTLEANMHFADLFPPGYVLWAVRESDLRPSHHLRVPPAVGSLASTGAFDSSDAEKIRLFEVLDVEGLFGQIVFARDMLSSHLPHQYDTVLHEM